MGKVAMKYDFYLRERNIPKEDLLSDIKNIANKIKPDSITNDFYLRERNIPKEDLLSDIKNIANKIKPDSITSCIYATKGKYGVTTIRRKFGSWNKALKEAGLLVNNPINISIEELFENLMNVWQQLGRQPIGEEMNKYKGYSKFSLATYERRFNTWNNALKKFIEYINNDNMIFFEDDNKNKVEIKEKRTPRKINWRLRAFILIRDNCICRMCGASPSKDSAVKLHVDHILPYSKGGETIEQNLQTLCSTCNIGKSDMT